MQCQRIEYKNKKFVYNTAVYCNELARKIGIIERNAGL